MDEKMGKTKEIRKTLRIHSKISSIERREREREIDQVCRSIEE